EEEGRHDFMRSYSFRPRRWHLAAALGLALVVGGVMVGGYFHNQAQAGADLARADPICTASAAPPAQQSTNARSNQAKVPGLPPGRSLGIPLSHRGQSSPRVRVPTTPRRT